MVGTSYLLGRAVSARLSSLGGGGAGGGIDVQNYVPKVFAQQQLIIHPNCTLYFEIQVLQC